jgi:hypothetical protein
VGPAALELLEIEEETIDDDGEVVIVADKEEVVTKLPAQ